jgi:hypothetical protein
MALRLPGTIERFERLMQKPSTFKRRQPFLVLVLFGQAKHVTREELERALTVLVDGADRPGTRVASVNRAMELRRRLVGTRATQPEPRLRAFVEHVCRHRTRHQRFVVEDERWRQRQRRCRQPRTSCVFD